MFTSPQADIPIGLPAMTAQRAFQLAQAAFDLASNAATSISVIGTGIVSGTVDPEGVVTAVVGTLYQNRTTKQYWTKNSGSGNTGWLPFVDYSS